MSDFSEALYRGQIAMLAIGVCNSQDAANAIEKAVCMERARIAGDVERRMNREWGDATAANPLSSIAGDALHEVWVWLGGPDLDQQKDRTTRGESNG